MIESWASCMILGVAMRKVASKNIEAASRKGMARPRREGIDRRALGARRSRRAPRPPSLEPGEHDPAADAAPPEGRPMVGEGGHRFHVVVVGTGSVGKTSL